MKINFRVDGKPEPKGRPRAYRANNYIRFYTPKSTKDWEESIARQSLQYKPPSPHLGPVEMDIIFYLPRPKSLSKKVIIHMKKPDVDNLTKCVCDALEGIFFKNDSQIFRITLEKHYTEMTPGIHIQMRLI